MTDRCRSSSGIGRVVSWQVCWTRRGLRWWVDRWSRHVIWTSCCCVDDKLWSRNSCDGLEAHSRSRGRPIVRSNMNWRRRPERRGMWVEQSSMWYFGQNIILKKIFYCSRRRRLDRCWADRRSCCRRHQDVRVRLQVWSRSVAWPSWPRGRLKVDTRLRHLIINKC